MTSPTDHPDQSGRTSAASDGDATDGAGDLTQSTAPTDESDGTGVDAKTDADTVEASSRGERGVVAATFEQRFSYKSPLPPPSDMREYEAIEAGAFNRILQLTEQENAHRINEAEREGAHRRTVVENDQKAGIADQKRGMYLGFAFGALMVGGAVGCAALGQPWPAAVLAGGVSAVIAVFVWRQRRGNSDDQDRP